VKELPKDLAGCHKVIGELLEQVAVIPLLIEQIEELKSQINQNSNNSHWPSSKDKHKNPRSKPAFPRKKGKRSGGQKGHTGKTLELVCAPDELEIHNPKKCICGTDLEHIRKYIDERRQVFDLPTPKLKVIEHISMSCSCPNCDRKVKGKFPELVKSRVQYGSGVQALSLMLNTSYKIPFAKVGRLFADLFGYKINDSTQITIQKKGFVLLEKPEAKIKEALLNGPVGHADETGVNVNGKNNWLHGFTSPMYTYLFAHSNRGKKAIDSSKSIVPTYKGWMIHDCWQSYFKYKDAKHALCGCHLLRELQALIEKDSVWAKRMHSLLLYAYHQSDQGKSVATDYKKIEREYRRICKMANEEEPPPKIGYKGKKPKKTKGRNLYDRLEEHESAVLAFAKHEEVPFTNNQGERDLRPAKGKLKIAGCFRTFTGLEIYARVQSFVSTTRKHQRNVFDELVATFENKNFLTFQRT